MRSQAYDPKKTWQRQPACWEWQSEKAERAWVLHIAQLTRLSITLPPDLSKGEKIKFLYKTLSGCSVPCSHKYTKWYTCLSLITFPFLILRFFSNGKRKHGNKSLQMIKVKCTDSGINSSMWRMDRKAFPTSISSDFSFTFHFHALEKEMATHSSVLAWRIPGTGEPGGLPSMGLHRVGHDWSDLAAAAADEWPTIQLNSYTISG